VSAESILGASKAEKINQFLMLIKDPEVQPFFKILIKHMFADMLQEDPEFKHIFQLGVDNSLAISDLNLVKRVTATETMLGLSDYPIEGDESESTIPKQISLLSDQIKEVIKKNNKQTVIEPICESVHVGMSKTTARAILLFKDVIEVAIEGKEQIVIGSREIKDFLTHHIQPEYRVGDVSNFRKVKKDVLTTLKKLLPDNVLLDKKKYGHREIRLVYGP
jgi:hypothetical protein